MGSFEHIDIKFSASDIHDEIYNNTQTEVSFMWESCFNFEFIYPEQFLDNIVDDKISRLEWLKRDDDIDKLIRRYKDGNN